MYVKKSNGEALSSATSPAQLIALQAIKVPNETISGYQGTPSPFTFRKWHDFGPNIRLNNDRQEIIYLFKTTDKNFSHVMSIISVGSRLCFGKNETLNIRFCLSVCLSVCLSLWLHVRPSHLVFVDCLSIMPCRLNNVALIAVCGTN